MRIAGFILAVVCIADPVRLAAQGPEQTVREISVEEALQLFNRNSLRLRLSRSDAAIAVGVSRQTRAIPNPTAQFTREALSGGGAGYSETYLNLRQPVPLPWLVTARSASSRAVATGAAADVAADSNRLQFEIKQFLLNATAAERRLRVAHEVLEVFQTVERAAAARFAEGDLSGYDLRRIRVELARYERISSNASVRQNDARRSLTVALLPEAGDTILTARDFLDLDPPGVRVSALAGLALGQRPEVAARTAEITALDAQRREVRSARWLDGLAVTGGYKRQSDGLNGSFLGAEVSLPLWNRRGGAVAAGSARLQAAEERSRLTRHVVLADVESTGRAYQSALDRANLTEGRLYAETEDLLDIARASYAEGETDLLDLLDAADAYFTSRTDLIGLRAELWERYFDLERAVGGFDDPAPAREGGP